MIGPFDAVHPTKSVDAVIYYASYWCAHCGLVNNYTLDRLHVQCSNCGRMYTALPPGVVAVETMPLDQDKYYVHFKSSEVIPVTVTWALIGSSIWEMFIKNRKEERFKDLPSEFHQWLFELEKNKNPITNDREMRRKKPAQRPLTYEETETEYHRLKALFEGRVHTHHPDEFDRHKQRSISEKQKRKNHMLDIQLTCPCDKPIGPGAVPCECKKYHRIPGGEWKALTR